MAKPLFEKFLCCISIQIGTTIIAGGFLLVLIPFFLFSALNEFDYDIAKINGFQWISDSLFKVPFITLLMILILINSLMLLGIYQRNHYLFLPWLIGNVIFWLGLIGLAIFTVTVLEVLGTIPLVLGIVGFIALIAIYVYMWLVVYSHYAILQQENNRGRYDKQPYRR